MSSFFAFLHHLAAFGLVATLCIEFVLIREPLTDISARRLLKTDALFGLAAGAVLIIGFARVVYFEKGAAFYFGNGFFLAKLTLFALVGVLSIQPTKEFLSWRPLLKAGRLPVVEPARIRKVRSTITRELICVVLLILCAALMANGVGSFA